MMVMKPNGSIATIYWLADGILIGTVAFGCNVIYTDNPSSINLDQEVLPFQVVF